MNNLFLVALLSLNAHGGWFKDKCLSLLTMPDPYQFQESSEVWVKRELQRLQIRANFGKATAEELDYVRILENELARRERLRAIGDDQ